MTRFVAVCEVPDHIKPAINIISGHHMNWRYSYLDDLFCKWNGLSMLVSCGAGKLAIRVFVSLLFSLGEFPTAYTSR